MAKWKEIPTNKKAILPRGWSMTAEEMDALLDDVFYKVFRRYPYEGFGITGPQDCTDYICFCETEEMQCGDRIEKENE
tara:strand:+ start:405 stop:638 length:234 start_codon:yes stop_codon:yes gene_type:complete